MTRRRDEHRLPWFPAGNVPAAVPRSSALQRADASERAWAQDGPATANSWRSCWRRSRRNSNPGTASDACSGNRGHCPRPVTGARNQTFLTTRGLTAQRPDMAFGSVGEDPVVSGDIGSPFPVRITAQVSRSRSLMSALPYPEPCPPIPAWPGLSGQGHRPPLQCRSYNPGPGAYPNHSQGPGATFDGGPVCHPSYKSSAPHIQPLCRFTSHEISLSSSSQGQIRKVDFYSPRTYH